MRYNEIQFGLRILIRPQILLLGTNSTSRPFLVCDHHNFYRIANFQRVLSEVTLLIWDAEIDAESLQSVMCCVCSRCVCSRPKALSGNARIGKARYVKVSMTGSTHG